VEAPTAQQFEAERHVIFETELAKPVLGEATIAHEVPSHRRIRVSTLPPSRRESPTAQQSDAETHVTSER
jgi:hypothetical protein